MDTVVPGAFIVRVLAPLPIPSLRALPCVPSFADIPIRQSQCRQQSSCGRQQSPPLRLRRLSIRACFRSLRAVRSCLARHYPVLPSPAQTVRGRRARYHRPPLRVRCNDPSAERAPLHDPQTGARRQSDLAQAEPMPIVQIDAVHDNARVQRTVMQCHSRVGRVTNRA